MNAALARSRLIIAPHAGGGLAHARPGRRRRRPRRRCWCPRRPRTATSAGCSTWPRPRPSGCADGHAPDLVVRLSIDPDLQRTAAHIVRSEIAARRPPRRRPPGGAGGPGAGRRRPRDGRRRRPPLQPVQPRGPGRAPAGLGLQALRLRRGAGERGAALRHAHRPRRSGWGAGAPPTTAAATAGTVTVADALARSINTVAVGWPRRSGPTVGRRDRLPLRHLRASRPTRACRSRSAPMR